jgi:hypothetical protein
LFHTGVFPQARIFATVAGSIVVDQWNAHKKRIDGSSAPRVFVHERELWFAQIGLAA